MKRGVVPALLLWIAGCGGERIVPAPSAHEGSDAGEVATALDAGVERAGPDAAPARGELDATTADGGAPEAGAARSCPDLPGPLPPLGERRCDGLAAIPAHDPSALGPYPVGVKTLDLEDPLRAGRRPTTEVWYPADEAARGGSGESYLFGLLRTSAVRDAARSMTAPRSALVLFSHGFRGVRYQSAFLMTYLASHGYVVAAMDHQGNTLFDGSSSAEQSAAERLDDMAFVMEAMQARNVDPNDFFHESFDPARVAISGHSFGASMSLVLGSYDNREMVVVSIAPKFDARMASVFYPDRYDLRSALLVLGGLADGTAPPDETREA
jgi:serine aminopeptidase S33 family